MSTQQGNARQDTENGRDDVGMDRLCAAEDDCQVQYAHNEAENAKYCQKTLILFMVFSPCKSVSSLLSIKKR